MVGGCTFIRYCAAIVAFAIVVFAVVVLAVAVVVPLFCVLGSIASYRCARHCRAMLLPSELFLTSLSNHRCLAC